MDSTTKRCRACGTRYTGDTHKDCPVAKAGTIVLSSDSDTVRDGDAGNVTTRTCPACGLSFQGEYHTNCPSQKGRAKKPPSSPSSLDALPPEVQAHAEDPAYQLNQYILVKEVGKGGMGAVWKAWDRSLTRWVAIKFLIVTEEEDVARFRREAKLAARLRHPNIAPIYEVGVADSGKAGQSPRHYLAMEYIDGLLLSDVKKPFMEMLELFVKIAQGVEAAHRNGVIHRDLKPANIMLTSDGWPYVMDFGLAKAYQGESSISVSGSVMGTPAYMPPEQAQGHLDEIDARSDVYSLGSTMYAVFCRRQPFAGQSAMDVLMQVVQADPPTPRSIVPEIPAQVDAIIRKAMAKKKEDRYASAQELADDIQRFLSDEEILGRPPTLRRTPQPASARSAWRMIAIVLVLAALAGGGYLLLNRPEPPVPVVVEPPPKPPPDPGPSPAEIAARKQQEWLRSWLALREALDVQRYRPGDGGLKPRATELLSRMESDAALSDRGIVTDWLNREAREAVQAIAALRRDRDEATRLLGWCDLFLAAAEGVDDLTGAAREIAQSRDDAAAVANYRGSFTLKLAVGPYAEVVRLAREGKEVSLAQRFTPLVISDLEIGEYVLELSHPKHGKKTVTISPDRLREGKTVLVGGRMRDASLRVTELP